MNNDERRDLILKLCCGMGSDPAFRALTQLVSCMAAELDDARQALGEAWLAGGVSVAEGIRRRVDTIWKAILESEEWYGKVPYREHVRRMSLAIERLATDIALRSGPEITPNQAESDGNAAKKQCGVITPEEPARHCPDCNGTGRRSDKEQCERCEGKGAP